MRSNGIDAAEYTAALSKLDGRFDHISSMLILVYGIMMLAFVLQLVLLRVITSTRQQRHDHLSDQALRKIDRCRDELVEAIDSLRSDENELVVSLQTRHDTLLRNVANELLSAADSSS